MLVLRATPLTYVAHALAVVCAVMVLVWCSSFRGGLAWESPNKSLIFNVSSYAPSNWSYYMYYFPF